MLPDDGNVQTSVTKFSKDAVEKSVSARVVVCAGKTNVRNLSLQLGTVAIAASDMRRSFPSIFPCYRQHYSVCLVLHIGIKVKE